MATKTTSTDIAAAIIVILGSVGFIFLMTAGSVLLNGWALHILWSWFIVPVFGLPLLTIAQSIGLATVVSFITYQHIDTQESTKEGKFIDALVKLICRPLLTVAFAWVVYQFV